MSHQGNVKLILGALVAVGFLGCVSAPIDSDRSAYFDAAYNDRNRVPASMAPPENAGVSAQKLDPFNMRTQADYYFAMGEAHSFDGNHQKAIESFKMVQIYDAESARVPLRIAAEYVKAGTLTQAVEYAQTAEKLDPKMVEPHMLLGGIYSSTRAYAKALEQYQKVLELSPKNAEAPLYMGAIFAEQKQYDKAVQYFENLGKNDDYAHPHLVQYYIGRVRADQGTKAAMVASEKAFLKALSLKADHVDSVLALSSLYKRQSKDDKSVKVLRDFQKEHGPNLRIAENLSQTYLEGEKYDLAFEQLEILEANADDVLNVKVKMALILIEQKKYNRAVEKLQDVLMQVPESDKIRFYLAAVLEEMGQGAKAIVHFNRIGTESQYFGEAVVHSAYLLKQERKVDEALVIVNKALVARDDLAQLYAVQASLLDEKGEYVTAEDSLEKAVGKFPDNVQLRFFLGSIKDRLGKKDDVITNMKVVVELDPNHIQGLNYLAFTYAEINLHLDDAEKLAKRALALDPKDGYILDTYGWILHKKGKTREAVKVLEQAYFAQPSESVIAEHLGDVYFKLQMNDRARSMYQKAIESETDEVKANTIRSKISAIQKQELVGSGREPASNP